MLKTRLNGGESLECRRVLASAAPADPTSTALGDAFISLAEDNAGVRVTVPLGGTGHGAGDIVSVYLNGGASPGGGILMAQSAALTGKESSVSLTIAAGSLGTAGNEGKVNKLYSEIIDLTGSSPTGTSYRSPGVAFTLDTTPPAISAFGPGAGVSLINKAGATIALEATASEPVTGSIKATLDTGTVVTLTAAVGGSTKLTGTYTVGKSDNSIDLSVASYTLGSLKDVAGNPLANTTGGIGSIGGAAPIVVDTAPPTVATVVLPPAATYFVTATPQVLTLTVNFSEPVTLPTTAFVRGYIGPNGNANAFATPADFLFSQSLNGGASYEFTYTLVSPTPPAAAIPPDIDGMTFDTTIWDVATPAVPAVINDTTGNPVSPSTGALAAALTPNPTAINIGPSTTVAKIDFDAVTPSPRVEPVQVITITFKDATGAGVAVPFGPGLGSLALTEDFQLRRNGVLVDLSTPDANGKKPEFTYVTNPSDPYYASRFQLRNMAHLTSGVGAYRLTFSDLGIGPSAELAWSVTYPTPGELTAVVSPQPVPADPTAYIRTTPVDSVKIVFTSGGNPVTVKNVDTNAAGKAIAQFRLYKDDVLVPFPDTARVTGSGSTYYVSGLAPVTQDTGAYQLLVVPEATTNSLGQTVQISTLADTPMIAPTGASWQYANTTVTVAVVDGPAGGTGVVRQNGWIDLKVSFSSAVVVDPNLPAPSIDVYLSTYGKGSARATCIGGSGTKDLTFRYTIQDGDASPAGVAFASTVALNGGSILDVTGKQPLLSFKQPSGTGIVVDGLAPAVLDVDMPVAGAYMNSLGDRLTFTVHFSEPVRVAGSPKLAFTLGTSTKQAVLSAESSVQAGSATGTDTLVFEYAVGAGDSGRGVTVTGLVLAGGTIRDVAGNDASLTATGSSPNAGVNEVGIAPNGLTVLSKRYKAGDYITYAVSFTRPVKVDTKAPPSIPLIVGGATKSAGYFAGSTTSTITFRYLVQPGDLDLDGVAFAGTTIDPGTGGGIQDLGGAAAFLGFAPPDTSGVIIDTIPPVAAGFVLPADGQYRQGARLSFGVAFDEAMQVSGSPQLSFTYGAGQARKATFDRVDGVTVVFRYDVLPADPDGTGVTVSGVVLNGGTIADLAGNAAVVTGLTAATTAGVGIDNTPPRLVSVTAPATPNGVLPAMLTFTLSEPAPDFAAAAVSVANAELGALVKLTATTYEATLTPTAGFEGFATVTVSADSYHDAAGNSSPVQQFQVKVDANAPTATLAATVSSITAANASATITAAFSEAVAALPTILMSPTGLGVLGSLSGSNPATATFTASAGREGVVSFWIADKSYTDIAGNPGAPATAITIAVDTLAPAVTNVTSTTANGSYRAGDTVTIVVTFREAVTVTGGTPTLRLNAGSSSVATWTGVGSGTNALTFAYVVEAGDATTGKFDYADTSALAAGGATIRDAAGNDASLTLPAVGALGSISSVKNISIDTLAPSISISATPTSLTGTQKAVVKFVTSSDTAATILNGRSLPAGSVFGGTLSALKVTSTAGGREYTATFTPALNASEPGGITVPAGWFTDKAGNTNDFTTMPGTIVHVPTVQSITTAASAGRYTVGAAAMFVTVTFDEAVSINGAAPRLALNVGANRFATYVSGSGTNAVTFRYAVQAGDNTAGLDYASTAALVGDLRNAADTAAVTTLPAPGDLGSLAQQAAIVVDTTAPTVAAIRPRTTVNGTYGVGSKIRLQVDFSEPVVVGSGTPTLRLNAGASAAAVWNGVGSGTSTLVFVYTVQPGDNVARLDASGAGALAGVLRDLTGNAANLATPAGSQAGALAANAVIAIDTVAPAVVGVESATAAGSYREGSGLWLRVRFSENVVVTGSPQLLLNAAAGRVATYSAGSGTNVLTFLYVVQPGDTAATLDYASRTALLTNGGTITDLGGTPAALLLASPGGPGSIAAGTIVRIDTTAPQIASVQSLSANGTYGFDQTVRIAVVLSEPVKVSGSAPSVLLNTKPGRQATFEGPFDAFATTLTFRYAIQPGDAASRLDVLGFSANGASIVDQAGNAAAVGLPAAGTAASLAGSSVIVIDALVRARVSGLAAAPETAPSYTLSLTKFALNFNTPVSGLTLNAIKLFYEGRSVSLSGATLAGSGSSYTLTLPAASTSLKGLYRLRIGGVQTGVVTSGGIAMEPATNLYWRRV